MPFSRRNTAPVLYLWINDKPAEDLRRLVTKFVTKRNVAKAAETTFSFRNDSRKLLDDSRLFPNTRWFFWWGFFDDMSPIHVGLVRNVEPSYEMKSTIDVSLYDLSASLSTTFSGRNWGAVRSSEIARQIASIHSMEAVVEKSTDVPKKAFVQPNGVNDLQYLRDLAAQIDFELVVEGNPPVLFYRKKAYDQTPAMTLTIYDDPTHRAGLLSFKPKVKSLGPIKTASSGANTKGGKDSKTASDKDAALGGKKASFREGDDDSHAVVLALGPGGDTEATVVKVDPASRKDKGMTVATPSGANAGVAAAHRKQMLDRANEADAKHAFTPSIEPGKIYEILGTEKQVNGKWQASETTSELSVSGASTTIGFKRNAKGKGGKDSKNPNDKNAKSSGGDAGDAGVVELRDGQEASYLTGPQAKASRR